MKYETAYGPDQRDKLAATGWKVYWVLIGKNGFVYEMEKEIDR